MAALSAEQVARLALNAGLTPDSAAVAVAVARAESGFNPRAHNRTPPDNSYGLWQINMLGSMGPARRKQFGISSNDALFDPATNARAMAMISNKGRNWTPWTTYTRGTYRAYMSQAKSAVANAGGQTVDVGLPGSDEFASITKIFVTLSDPKMWVRIGLFTAGALLVIVALVRLAGDGQVKPMTKKILKMAGGK